MKKILLTIGFLLTFTFANCQLAGIIASQTVAGGGYPEMITDGDFPDATNWATDAMWAITGGVAQYTDGSSGRMTQIDGSMVSSIAINTDYRLTFDLVTVGTAQIQIDNYGYNVNFKPLTGYTNGAITIDFTTPADVLGGGIGFRGHLNSTNNFTIDNVSLKRR